MPTAIGWHALPAFVDIIPARQPAEGPTHHIAADIAVMTDIAEDRKKQAAD